MSGGQAPAGADRPAAEGEAFPVPTAHVPRPSPTLIDPAAVLAGRLAISGPHWIEAWGGHVYVRELSGAERDAFEVESLTQLDRLTGGTGAKATLEQQRRAQEGIRARLAVWCVCDAEGRALFTRDQAEQLGRQSGRALTTIYALAAPLNGLTDADLAELSGN